MRILTLLFCLIFIQSCKNDDETCDYALYDPVALRTVFIKLVDTNGNNLIENETYNSNNIEVSFNGYTNTSPFFENTPELENLIAVTVIGIEGDNTYEIKLNNTITDTLILNLDSEILGNEPCTSTYFTINNTSYNNTNQTVEDLNNWNYLITVVK